MKTSFEFSRRSTQRKNRPSLTWAWDGDKLKTKEQELVKTMHSTNYFDTLICPAEDCSSVAKAPERPGSVAALQYELLAESPYSMTSDDVLSAVAAQRKTLIQRTYLVFARSIFRRDNLAFEHRHSQRSTVGPFIQMKKGSLRCWLQTVPSLQSFWAMKTSSKSTR